jgi:hypothetical protein
MKMKMKIRIRKRMKSKINRSWIRDAPRVASAGNPGLGYPTPSW